MGGDRTLAGTLGEPFPFSPWYGVFPALGLTLIIGPVEELGWRGVAVLAVVIFGLNRKAMLTRDGAVTDIVPG